MISTEILITTIQTDLEDLLAKLPVKTPYIKTLHLELFSDINCLKLLSKIRIKLASPTQDILHIISVLQLRLASCHFNTPMTAYRLKVFPSSSPQHQTHLYTTTPDQRRQQAQKALKLLQEHFDPCAIYQYQPTQHLCPERGYTKVPCLSLKTPKPHHNCHPQLIRRLFTTPKPLNYYRYPFSPLWLLGSLDSPPIQNHWGPYPLQEGWWRQDRTHRYYYYVQDAQGQIYWVFFDPKASQWFQQGAVG